jgi:hypothetical protein
VKRKPIELEVPLPIEYKEHRLGDSVPFGGLNLRDMDIGEGQMAYGSKNVNLDDGGKPGKRKGQAYVYSDSLGTGAINGLYKELFNGRKVFAWGTSIYSQVDAAQPVQLISGLSNKKGYFYVFNDVLYYKNGVNFIAIQSNFSAAALVGYIPTLLVNTAPTGGGTAYEQRNFKSPGFKILYTGTAGATAYSLPYTGLDATAVTARKIVGTSWTNLVEGTDFSVDRTTGIVTFNTAPGAIEGVTNNVEITAYKTFTGFDGGAGIDECLYVDLFGGGTNDSRIFMAGSSTYKNVYFYSGLTGNTAYDATYFPVNAWNRIGSDAKSISGWSKMYGRLIPCKEDGIFSITYSKTDTTVSFPVSILNSQIGCDMPGSVGVVKSYPVFCNSESGLHVIVSTLIENEKNVEQLSVLVNGGSLDRPGILNETVANLKLCSSVNDGSKYYLCVGSKVWVWDYERSPYTGNQNALIWYFYDNINANNWAYFGRNLYYGDRTIGQLVTFQDAYNDFENAIDAPWKSKINNYVGLDFYKTISEVWISSRAAGCTLEVTYYNNDGEQSETIILPTSGTEFDWDNWDWDNFTWDSQKYSSTVKLRPNLKKIIENQIQLRNNVVNENLSILSLITKYTVNGKVK